ncbi:YggS family pyridoxal phosphate-dependent enzyme [Chryseosolibacter indicus]|uniref:Pyridoxal phosphate homeostasis protein n=1 Tax=Chryseosolibacter indicus TaxID=2782351 RepID=A0ABS5VN63_9BACT|nr:YggS family pyridoxal phosphate-dependent enzyme [Chryseosolibacter indicus]MBT1702458.1 YggS family pyridoxal phosphate-dependent enzyme [Chryseosolibacter indicus]
MSIRTNLEHIKQLLPADIKLIAVTKTHPVEKVREVYEAGHKIMGENKVQELTDKYENLPKDIEWHLIGHLQSNKVKYIAPFVSLIHAVDSVKLLEEINKQAKKNDRVIPCLFQIHIAEEETKFGLSEEEVTNLISSSISELGNVSIVGLMGMATFTDNKDQIRKEFKGLRTLFERLRQSPLPANVQMKELSMGMSGDFKIAIEEGSTMVRVGSAIFGERNYLNKQ